MHFSSEHEFQKTLMNALKNDMGWNREILNFPTEKDLINNWKNIIFQRNKGENLLNNVPLDDAEMQQILDKFRSKSPVEVNAMLMEGVVTFKRTNKDAGEKVNKEVSVTIFEKSKNVIGGSHFYQIANQPLLQSEDGENKRKNRGDLMLLIDGIPLYHIELKNSGVGIDNAVAQIKTYIKKGRFSSGIYSLVQIFIAMTPNDMLYFANQGRESNYNKFLFRWATEKDNIPMKKWEDILKSFLKIPMAHDLVGYYTIADKADNSLKVLRSYQYYAVNAIKDKVIEHNNKKRWDEPEQKGGYIWHTTGSGKTMTSYKTATLLLDLKIADKVIFLTDRIELGTQTISEYRSFANEDNISDRDKSTVKQTENTNELIDSILSKDSVHNGLIVTSIQKMANIGTDDELARRTITQATQEKIDKKHIVIIVDEAHRSTFGKFLESIRKTFRFALRFGFTGTPIMEDNKKNNVTTADVFGPRLHTYTLANGMNDNNVLKFHYMGISTVSDSLLRKKVAMREAKIKTEEDFALKLSSPTIQKYLDPSITKMYSYIEEDEEGKRVKYEGIEDMVPSSSYGFEHHKKVVEKIIEIFIEKSVNFKFHAILATESIEEAISYFDLFEQKQANFKFTCLYSTGDNLDGAVEKEEALDRILTRYNNDFFPDGGGYHNNADDLKLFKTDVSRRLANKGIYKNVSGDPLKGEISDANNRLDLLIVVNQMLTGYDSKYVNTLYLDKVLQNEQIIQAFSRTNRVLENQPKHFGNIIFFRKTHTMEKNIKNALLLYGINNPDSVIVVPKEKDIENAQDKFTIISDLFESEGIQNFETGLRNFANQKTFVKTFNELDTLISTAKAKGFDWNELSNAESEDFETDNLNKRVFQLLQKHREDLKVKRVDNDNGDEVDTLDLTYGIYEHDVIVVNGSYITNIARELIRARKIDSNSAQTQTFLEKARKQAAFYPTEKQEIANEVLNNISDFEQNDDKTDDAFTNYINKRLDEKQTNTITVFCNNYGFNFNDILELIESTTNRNKIEDNLFIKVTKNINISKANTQLTKEGKKPKNIFTTRALVKDALKQLILKVKHW